MNRVIQELIEKYPNNIQLLFKELRELIIKSVPCDIEERLWAKLPSFHVGERFVRLIPFKDHINVEAVAIIACASQLDQYRITPKGMLQLYPDQEIPYTVLRAIFTKSLMNRGEIP